MIDMVNANEFAVRGFSRNDTQDTTHFTSDRDEARQVTTRFINSGTMVRVEIEENGRMTDVFV